MVRQVGWSLLGMALCASAGVWAKPPGAVGKPAPGAADERSQTPLRVKSLAATCAACHGTDGHAVADTAIPALAGRPADELAGMLLAFKAGTRPGTVMPQLAKGYDDTQIDLLARYFAAQRRTGPPSSQPSTAASKRASAPSSPGTPSSEHPTTARGAQP